VPGRPEGVAKLDALGSLSENGSGADDGAGGSWLVVGGRGDESRSRPSSSSSSTGWDSSGCRKGCEWGFSDVSGVGSGAGSGSGSSSASKSSPAPRGSRVSKSSSNSMLVGAARWAGGRPGLPRQGRWASSAACLPPLRISIALNRSCAAARGRCGDLGRKNGRAVPERQQLALASDSRCAGSGRSIRSVARLCRGAEGTTRNR
jgi:hypothetical protein